ncbi:MAG: hypothetical protein JXR88_13235 [Clostridia bacterium]|nr:hypothetical protein [Clostridia bacterium]
MKSCSFYETMILNEETSDKLNEHLKNCIQCQQLQSLMRFETTEIKLPDAFIEDAVKEAFIKAEPIKRRHDFFSTIVFIAVAIILVSIIITSLMIQDQLLKYYFGGVSLFMPFTVPVFSIIRKKVVMK